MRHIRPRRGVGTIEILVALWIFLLLCALAGALVSTAHQRAAAVAGSTHAAAVLRHATAPLAHDIRGRATGDWIVLDDSTVDLVAVVGASAVCGTAGTNRLVIPARALADEPPLTTWSRAPQAGDAVQLLVPDSAGGVWVERRVVGVSGAAGLPCAIGATSPGARPPLLLTVAPPPPAVPPGTPIRILERVRYGNYRSGDGSWQLGRRQCGAEPAAPCEIVQPVAGPLQPNSVDPASRGLLVEPLAPDGTRLPRGDAARAAAFRIVLRAPRAAARAWTPFPRRGADATDSLVTWVATRNRP
ncbi:MAG TPA: hypothetical protein VGE02_04520 [Gemmatimonadales bacterium]